MINAPLGLRVVGHMSLAWIWARMAATGVANADSNDPIYAAEIATAHFNLQRLLPETHGVTVVIIGGWLRLDYRASN
ncbi:TPA: acyl-CoA dehydrogenase C-terminal domain-containing protein [Pseudomonas aeruginosa]|nr:acyl-CoA dehydrogenase C-terminal domain-containing protein [Pseudomonas aeruginosa]HEJ5778141.1 acyl-CoA dehydrogenase C-terminal domain-containing protein [Pseudomonas aeruginosa]